MGGVDMNGELVYSQFYVSTRSGVVPQPMSSSAETSKTSWQVTADVGAATRPDFAFIHILAALVIIRELVSSQTGTLSTFLTQVFTSAIVKLATIINGTVRSSCHHPRAGIQSNRNTFHLSHTSVHILHC
jgi:hypothetical protein